MGNRDADLAQLRHDWYTQPSKRRLIENAAKKIQMESGEIRSMRDALVKAHRSGNIEEIKDIHEIVKSKRKYRNE